MNLVKEFITEEPTQNLKKKTIELGINILALLNSMKY